MQERRFSTLRVPDHHNLAAAAQTIHGASVRGELLLTPGWVASSIRYGAGRGGGNAEIGSN